MLEASAIECLRGDRRLFAGVAFRLDAGELLALQGGNGTGKTSLLRIVCGLLPPAAGEIRWRGQTIGRLGEDYRRKVCFLGHLNAIKEEMTPLENLLTAAAIADAPLDADRAMEALETFGLAADADRACRDLSAGQKRRVTLARLVNDHRPLWLLDEPFVGLDASAVDRVAGLIGAHLGRGGLAMLTTHQPVAVAARVTHRLTLGGRDGAARC